MLCDHQVDALIVLTIHVGLADISAIARGIAGGVAAARAQGGAGKPLFTCIMDGDKLSAASALNGERLPNYAFPENAARVLGKLANYAEWRRRPQGVIPDFEDIQAQAARGLCQSIVKERGSDWLDGRSVRAGGPFPRAGSSCFDGNDGFVPAAAA